MPRVASRRSSEEDLQEALRRSCLETGHEQEQKGREIGRDKSNSQAEPRATFKPQEVALHTTPSRVKTGEMRRPQEGGSPYTPNRLQSKLPGPAGEEAREYQSFYTQDTPRDEHIGSRRPATHKVEEANRRAAQNHGGNKDRPGSGHPRDGEERGRSPGAKRYGAAVRQPGTGPGRRDQDHAGQEYPPLPPTSKTRESNTGRVGRTVTEPGCCPPRKSPWPPLLETPRKGTTEGSTPTNLLEGTTPKSTNPSLGSPPKRNGTRPDKSKSL